MEDIHLLKGTDYRPVKQFPSSLFWESLSLPWILQQPVCLRGNPVTRKPALAQGVHKSSVPTAPPRLEGSLVTGRDPPQHLVLLM